MTPRDRPLLAVALNGSREHARVPRTPAELAAAARACVEAGARVVHLHPFDGGRETLRAEPCAAALAAVRAACPGVALSLSTSAAIEADPARRLELVAGWTALPELVTANQGEPGIVELCEHLLARGVGIEAGLLALADAEALVRSGLAPRCVRVLVEPLDADPLEAVAHAAAMEQVLPRTLSSPATPPPPPTAAGARATPPAGRPPPPPPPRACRSPGWCCRSRKRAGRSPTRS